MMVPLAVGSTQFALQTNVWTELYPLHNEETCFKGLTCRKRTDKTDLTRLLGTAGATGLAALAREAGTQPLSVAMCSCSGLSRPGWAVCSLPTPLFTSLIKCLPGYCLEMTV